MSLAREGPALASRAVAAPSGIADPWVGITEAAGYLAVPVRTMYQLAQRGQVPGVKIGRTWRFKRSLLDERLGVRSAVARRRGRDPSEASASPGLGHGADLSAHLSELADPIEIARFLETRLHDLIGVDLVGLLHLEGDELVTLVDSDAVGIDAGSRFSFAGSALLRSAIERDEPCVLEDVATDPLGEIEPIPRVGIRALLCLPIKVAGTSWGVLALGWFRPRRISGPEIERLRSVANQAGLALHRAQLFRDTLRWSEHLERIEALSRQLNRARAVADVADAVAREIESVIDWHGLRFYLLAPDGETLEPIKLASRVPHYAHHTPELVRLRLGEGLGGHIAESGVAEIIHDAAHDARTRWIPGTDDVDESMIVVPLRYEDAVLGVIELFRLGRGAFDATDLRLAEIVGAQASVAIVNARQLEELERRSQALERRLASQRQLLAITERLLVRREGQRVFDAIADTLADVVPYDTLTIYLVDREAGCLVPTLARDEYAEQIMASRPALASGITGDVIAKGEAEIINDVAHDPRAITVPGTPVDQVEAMIVSPIRTSEGVIGALNLYRARVFDPDDLELVRLFTNHVAIALENDEIQRRLIEAAVTDPLTGLPNRRLFSDRVDHAVLRRTRTGNGLAVLFLDLDGFKLINDTLGHAVGDQVLAALATRLRACIRASETVARLGGDEFGILLEDVERPSQAIAAAERVLAALSEPLALPDRTVAVRATVGIALDIVDTPTSSIELLRNADTAMYHAKADPARRLALFEPAMYARQLARLELEDELRDALAGHSLRLVYQPIVELDTGSIVGAEALLRWDRPAGAVDPSIFVRLAEETGDIVPIGRWVLDQACRQARGWQLSAEALSGFTISVNASARELAEPDFVRAVATVLVDTGLPAERLTIEITESVMLADETSAITAVRRLRDAGVHIAVDDFGTGYSSLSYLNRLPVDGLKIDRSFVHRLGPGREQAAIVSATIGFASALGLSVTAEGIETEEQLRRLRELGCGRGQGFFFARPMGADAMGRLLANGRCYALVEGPDRGRRTVRTAKPSAHASKRRSPSLAVARPASA